jgi:3D (Asp-Asp-Asp) domain-containing protein
MKKIVIFVFLAVVMMLVSPLVVSAGEPFVYTVKPGDTLIEISQRTLGEPARYLEIAELNGISNPNFISVGQQILIPSLTQDIQGCWQAVATVTAYSPEPEQNWGDPHKTFKETDVHWGTVAVDPKVIPFWSKIYVPGYGWGTAEDTGGGIKGLHIDVWMPLTQSAKNWGVKKLKITVCQAVYPF